MASSGDEDKIGIDNLSVRVECAVCNVRLGPQAMTMHLQGKPHLKKVEHALMEESKFNWCPICCVQLSSLKQAFSHCMSKQHCEKLLKQQGVDFGPKRKPGSQWAIKWQNNKCSTWAQWASRQSRLVFHRTVYLTIATLK